MNKKFLTSSLACLVLGLAPTAWAQLTVSQTVDYAAGPTPYGGSATPPAFSAGVSESVGQFNAAAIDPAHPGDVILESVTFSFTETVTGSASIWNSSNGGVGTGSSQTISEIVYNQNVSVADAGGNVFGYAYATTSDGTSLLSTIGTQPSGVTVVTVRPPEWSIAPTVTAAAPDVISLNFSATLATYVLSSGSVADASGFTYTGEGSTGSSVLAEFEGSGTLPLTMTAEDNFTFSGGSVGYQSSTTTSGALDVTYDYEVVPEPATWMGAALLFGVVGISTGSSLLRKRSQKMAKTGV